MAGVRHTSSRARGFGVGSVSSLVDAFVQRLAPSSQALAELRSGPSEARLAALEVQRVMSPSVLNVHFARTDEPVLQARAAIYGKAGQITQRVGQATHATGPSSTTFTSTRTTHKRRSPEPIGIGSIRQLHAIVSNFRLRAASSSSRKLKEIFRQSMPAISPIGRCGLPRLPTPEPSFLARPPGRCAAVTAPGVRAWRPK